MSLAFLACIFLSFSIIPSALAGPQASILPSLYLSSIIPTCAQSCFEDFIASSFPTSTCPDQQDIVCLCTSDSCSGYTLGEGAIQCVAAACTDQQTSDLVNAYELCAQVPSALPMTHGTLTATLIITTTTQVGKSISTLPGGGMISFSSSPFQSSAAASSGSVSGIDTSMSSPVSTGLLTATGSPYAVTSPAISFTGSMPPLMTTLMTTTFPVSTAATATSSSAAVLTPMLTKSQVAGVAVGGTATAGIAFGLLFFFCCIRRRRKEESKRLSDSSFGGDQAFEHHIELPSDTVPRPPQSKENAMPARTVPTTSQRVLGVPGRFDERDIRGLTTHYRPEDIGLAIATENYSQDVSPISVASYRTTSRLLPDKPNYNLFPSPHQHKAPSRPERPLVGIAEDSDLRVMPPMPPGNKPVGKSWAQMDTSQAVMQAYPDSNKSRSTDPFLDRPNDPRARMYAMERRRASRDQLPRIITPNSGWKTPSMPPYIRPPQRDIMRNLLPPALVIPPSSQLKPIPESTNSSLYSRYTSYSAYHPPISAQSQILDSAPYRRKSGGKRPLTYYTSGSDTEFEDEGDEVDEIPPPPLPLTLSPVQESPMRTPLSRVRYPTIPASSVKSRRPSPESPTRKPPMRIPRVPVPAPAPAPATASFPASAPLPTLERPKGKDKALPATPPIPVRSSSRLSDRRGAQEPVELYAGTPPRRVRDEDKTRSAKWKILCSPGLESLGGVGPQTANVASPRTVRTVGSNDRTPKMESNSPHIWG